MMCQHCKKTVEGILKNLGLDAEVELENKRAVVYGGDINEAEIKAAIEAAGYDFKSIEK